MELNSLTATITVVFTTSAKLSLEEVEDSIKFLLAEDIQITQKHRFEFKETSYNNFEHKACISVKRKKILTQEVV